MSDNANKMGSDIFLLTPLREGRPQPTSSISRRIFYFYSRPCGRGDVGKAPVALHQHYFYSRPCGRGDAAAAGAGVVHLLISTHAPAGGATPNCPITSNPCIIFLLTPLREGRHYRHCHSVHQEQISTHAPAGGATFYDFTKMFNFSINFYSRPCGRGDNIPTAGFETFVKFLLTPLREGRRSTPGILPPGKIFLLTPLREGRLAWTAKTDWAVTISTHAPAGGATRHISSTAQTGRKFLLTPLREGRRAGQAAARAGQAISTHAPAGGATLSMVRKARLR